MVVVVISRRSRLRDCDSVVGDGREARSDLERSDICDVCSMWWEFCDMTFFLGFVTFITQLWHRAWRGWVNSELVWDVTSGIGSTTRSTIRPWLPWSFTPDLLDHFGHLSFEELKQYKAKEGHYNAPRKYSENKQLGVWVSTQRSQNRLFHECMQSSIIKGRKSALESIGIFCKSVSRIQRFQELKQYKLFDRFSAAF